MGGSEVVEISEIRKRFGDELVLEDISFTVSEGEIISLVGPSGCGKTTLLHILAGLENGEGGGYQVQGSHSLVFQEPRLLPWRTIRENIRIRNDLSDDKVPPSRVETLLEMTGLESYSEAYPRQVSGGMKQRAAFARALAVEPDILFMDEPFSSLDYVTKKNLMQTFQEILEEEEITAIYVTHNLENALSLGDRIAVLDQNPCTVLEIWEEDNVSDVSEIEDYLEQSYISENRF